MFHFSFDIMINNGWKYLGDFHVGYQRDLFDGSMVVFDKTKMFYDITQTLPPRELPGLDDQSVELSFAFDDRINLSGYCREVIAGKWTLRLEHAIVA